MGSPAPTEAQPTLPADVLARFDRDVADRMVAASNGMGGLVGFLGLQLVRFEPGRLWAVADLDEQLVTMSGNVHGGALLSILDHITGAAVYPLMPDGWWGATAELKLNYVMPVQGGRVEADATVLSMGNRSAVVRGELYAAGRLACAAQGTIALVAPKASS